MKVEPKFRIALGEALEGINYDNCLLFGSRAGDSARDDSDYDILVILNQSCSRQEKNAISNKIRSHFARYLIPADVLVKTREDIESYGWLPGGTIRHALRDGVPV